MVKKGEWVRIHSIVLKAEERTAKIPDDTQKCDLQMWTKGYLQEDAEIGDEVTVIKDLKVKGSSTPLKVGTKVKSIRLIHDAPDDHDIDCKVDGFGQMKLKSSVVKKA